ncbi:MAG TPA: hypothetical protein VGZ22_19170 [Isosphaeraceae bacterium]|jgi:hypothetical protein|nr:hypothetical protein [Isosphaeraceae bacterium]
MLDNPIARRKALGLLAGVPLLAVARADDKVNLVGTWTWSWKDSQGDTHRHVLEVEAAGAGLSARERFDDEKPVKINDLKLSGRKVNFSVLRGKRRAAYQGTLASADTINGIITVTDEGAEDSEFGWTAKREPAKK